MAVIPIPREAIEGNALFEGYHERLSNDRVRPYLCPAHVATIGFGTTVYPDGKKVRMSDPTIDRSTAERYMANDLQIAARGIKRDTAVPLTDMQFSALVMFANNVGTGAYRGSTLRYFVNRKDWTRASREFLKWVNGGGRRLTGLVRRRKYESALFLRGSVAEAAPSSPKAVASGAPAVTQSPPPTSTWGAFLAKLWPWQG